MLRDFRPMHRGVPKMGFPGPLPPAQVFFPLLIMCSSCQLLLGAPSAGRTELWAALKASGAAAGEDGGLGDPTGQEGPKNTQNGGF